MLEKFCRFLKNEGAYRKFCKKLEVNNENEIEVDFTRLSPDKYVIDSISWTFSDAEYWNRIHLRWNDELKKIVH